MKTIDISQLEGIAVAMKHRRRRNPDEDQPHFNGREVQNTAHVIWGARETFHETKMPVFYAYARAGDEKLYAMVGVETPSGIMLLDPEWGRAFTRNKCPYLHYMRQKDNGDWERF